MNFYVVTIVVLVIILLAQSYLIWKLWRRTQSAALGLTELAEDTLKELYHLSRENPHVHDRDLSRAVGIQPGRLSLVMNEMARRGWAGPAAGVGKDHIQITPLGEQRAVELIRAHRLWERYLSEKEGLPLDALHEEAMRREHVTTPEQADLLDEQLGFPKFDPHGDPIPERGGALEHHAGGTALTAWSPGRVARIVHVEDEPPSLFAQLAMLGLTPGAQVEVDERTPGRVLVWSGRQRLALTPAAANMIFVAEAPLETLPLSELAVGQAAAAAAVNLPGNGAWTRLGLRPGVELTAVHADPLGDPITYLVGNLPGTEMRLTRQQANQVLLDAASVREVPLPQRPWLQDELDRVRELFRRYGSVTVLKRALVFFGPAFVISVGYMDPGNWGTDIEGGARFGYTLLWVILLANLMAILLQILSAKLGIATGRSLPEVCRDQYPRWASLALWVTAELAAIATDLAEFLGGAVGFYLLFGIPLFPAALLTGVVISLILFLEHWGFRKLEMVIIGLIAVIGFVYMTEIWLARPAWGEIMGGFVPSIPIGATLVAVGIIGATVMPHNLYLHSALIQTRVRPSDPLPQKQRIYRLAIIDSVVALNGAFFVNAAILVMSAAVFSGGRMSNYSLESAHQTLTPLLGPLAGAAFAIALLASGLSSSATATLAGQVIMEGFIHHKANVWVRRGITMVPSLIVIGLGVDPLKILVLSQVSLSFQLPFAMIPLILFTNNPKIMGPFTNNRLTQALAWASAAIILGLNFILLYQTLFQ
jgi:manganese transport protein